MMQDLNLSDLLPVEAAPKSPRYRIASMTGYARATGTVEGASFQVELKSVNARGLDLRLRLAPGLDPLEPEMRRRLAASLTRGAVSLSVTSTREGAAGELVLNAQALGTVLDAIDRLSGRIAADPPRLDGILALKGVLEQREVPLPPDAEEALHRAVLSAFDRCIDQLLQARRAEGDQLILLLAARLDEIAALVQSAELHPSRSRSAILHRLAQQVDDLRLAAGNFSAERLHQEAVLLATKVDIREELDRLQAHVHTARQMLAEGGAIGRKLDFLAQEFNREANTLCSKSNAVELTTIGLELKAVIDQMREQVQNIE